MRKTTELIKRLLTGIVAAALVATALPFSAFAGEEIEVLPEAEQIEESSEAEETVEVIPEEEEVNAADSSRVHFSCDGSTLYAHVDFRMGQEVGIRFNFTDRNGRGPNPIYTNCSCIGTTLSAFGGNPDDVVLHIIGCTDNELVGDYPYKDSGNDEAGPPESGSWYNDKDDHGVWSLDKDGILTIESQGEAGTTLMNVQCAGEEEVRHVPPFFWAGHDPSSVKWVSLIGKFKDVNHIFDEGYDGENNVENVDLSETELTDDADPTNMFRGFISLKAIYSPAVMKEGQKIAFPPNTGRWVKYTMENTRVDAGEYITSSDVEGIFEKGGAVTEISLDSFKKDDDGVFRAVQPLGTTVLYKLNVSPEDNGRTGIRVLQPDFRKNYFGAFLNSNSEGNLSVRVDTFKNGGTPFASSYHLSEGPIAFSIVYMVNENGTLKEHEQKYEITVPKKSEYNLGKPSVTVTQTTDYSIELNATLPKNAEGLKNLWYEVKADAVGTVSPKMEEHIEFCQPADEGSTKIFFEPAKGDPPSEGDGCAQKYNISINLVQSKRGGLHEKIEEELRSYEGTANTLTASTKDPYYETNLGLNKKTTAVTIGQKNLLLATPKFSSKTTYVWKNNPIKLALLKDKDGNVVATSGEGGKLLVDDITGDVSLIECPSDMIPGKYTLYVYPRSKDATSYSKPATMAITFRAPMMNLSLIAPGSAYKDPQKALTINVKVKYGKYSAGNAYYDAANKKVAWSVEPTDPSNTALKAALKIKNGKVTVAKDYVLSGDKDANKFVIKAKALDLGDDGCEATAVVELISSAIVPAKMMIGNIEGSTDKKPAGHSSDDYFAQVFKLLDEEGNEIDPANASITVNPAKVMWISSYAGTWMCIPKSTGICTVKATMNDGSGKSLSRNFNIEAAKVSEYKVMVRSYYSSSDYTETKFDDSRTMTFNKSITRMVIYVSPVSATPLTLTESAKATLKPLNGSASAGKGYTNGITDDQMFDLIPKKESGAVEFSVSTADGILSDANGNNRFTINMNPEETGVLKADPKGYKLLCGCERTQTLDLTADQETVSKLADGNWGIFFSTQNGDYNVDSVASRLSKGSSIVVHNDGADDIIRLTVEDMTNTEKGNYDLYAAIWTTKTGGEDVTPVSPITKPVKVKVMLAQPKKPSVALKPGTVKMNAVFESEEVNSVIINFSKWKNAMDVENVEAWNNNANGRVNDFASYFKAETDIKDGKPFVRLVMKKQVEDTAPMIGWIKYTVTGEDGSTQIDMFEKVTVKYK